MSDVKYDPEQIERLVADVRRLIDRPGCPECGCTRIGDDYLTDMADQLEAARREIVRLRLSTDEAIGAVIHLRSSLSMLYRESGQDWLHGTRSDAALDALEFARRTLDLTDAYRAAKGKAP